MPGPRPAGRTALAALHAAFGPRLRFSEPLSRHTSFRIGGPADVFVRVETESELSFLQRWAVAEGVPLVVLGGGTNLLVSDRGVRGIVACLGRRFARVSWEWEDGTPVVRAGAAASLRRVVLAAAARGLGGLEFAEGIPGSVGGGLLMNAGAFGGELSSVVRAVRVVRADSEVVTLRRGELSFGYRRFDLPPGAVVTQVDLTLRPDPVPAIQARLAALRAARRARQPRGRPNAGSIFKNPPGAFAGALIEACGLKGRRVGRAMIAPEHANFILNLGGASAADVRHLMDEAVEAVRRRTGVELEPEIKLVGDWD